MLLHSVHTIVLLDEVHSPPILLGIASVHSTKKNAVYTLCRVLTAVTIHRKEV